MIDWGLTGSVDLSSYRPKVIVKCDGCGVTSSYTIRVKSKVNDGQVPWLCCKCVGNKEEVRKNHSDKQKEIWKREDYRKEREKSSTELWKNEEYREKLVASEKKYWNQEDVCNNLSSYYKKMYEDNPDLREEKRKRSLELWQDPAFRERVIKGTSEKWCGNPTSSLNEIFELILKECGLKYRREVAIGPYLFDFLIENAKPILVEVNGEYWHKLRINVERDNRKAAYVSSLSSVYDFKVIWEHEFYSRGRVKRKVQEWLGLVETQFLDFEFKDVCIKEVPTIDARVFFSSYHYMASLGKGGNIFGAYLDDELIACICFTYPSRKEVALKQGLFYRDVREISRLAIADSRHKKNFASWFISRTIKLCPKSKLIVAFADSTFHHLGIAYKASNFRYDGIVAPSYWYLSSDGWFMHKKTLYERAMSCKTSEREYAECHGYRKIFGGEKRRYVYGHWRAHEDSGSLDKVDRVTGGDCASSISAF